MKRQGRFLSGILAAVLAATVCWGTGGEAATRQEVAAISVNTAADFQETMFLHRALADKE